MEQERSIILLEDDLGIDIFPIYQSSTFQNRFPSFGLLYIEYQVAVIQKDLEITGPQIDELNRRLNEGDWSADDIMLPLKGELITKPELEFFDYILNKHLSFEHNGKVINDYTKEVW